MNNVKQALPHFLCWAIAIYSLFAGVGLFPDIAPYILAILTVLVLISAVIAAALTWPFFLDKTKEIAGANPHQFWSSYCGLWAASAGVLAISIAS